MTNRLDIKRFEKYGKLMVLSELEPLVEKSGNKVRMFRVLCECGNFSEVRLYSLRSGNTVSCGCLEIANRITHNKSKTPTYKSWAAMIQRCTNQRSTKYNYYGGIGVTVCDSWLNSFENFLIDMGERPKGSSLNRKMSQETNEPYKLYSKETCEWATKTTQSIDRRMQSNNTSGRTGVYLNKDTGNFFATIYVKGNKISLGTFKTFQEAVDARSRAELKYYGYNKV